MNQDNNWANKSFQDAATDYLFLLNKEYPETPALKLVGDRYRLTGLQRNILFRGITACEKAALRKAKISVTVNEKKLYVDGYNVIFTIMNYLLGKTIFIGNDGMLRDAGALYGNIENETFFYKAADILFDFIKKKGFTLIEIYLDESIPDNSYHAEKLQQKMAGLSIDGKLVPVKHADSELKKINDGLIATSDSGIIDASRCMIYDLARNVLETNLGINARELMAREFMSPRIYDPAKHTKHTKNTKYRNTRKETT